MTIIYNNNYGIEYLKTVIEFTDWCKNVSNKEITAVRLHDSESEFAIIFRNKPEPAVKSTTKAATAALLGVSESTSEESISPYKPGDKLIQIAGNSPGVGIGTVTSVLKDGRIKVKFFKHIKVLMPDNFRFATEEELNR